jgi:amino acid transporter
MRDQERAYSRFVLAAVAVYILASYCLLLLGRDAIDKLIEEDGFVEWVGTVGLFVGAVCFFWAFLIAGRPAYRDRYGPWKRLALLGLALVLFVAAGEEISWGQRLFGLSTPESLGAVNTQDETNLHNIDFFQNALSVDRLFQLFWIGFAVAVPVLSRFWEPARRAFERFLPIFPLSLALLFVFNQAVQTVFQWVLGRSPDLYHSTYAIGSSSVEIVESNVGLLLGMGALAVLRSIRREQPGATDAAGGSDADKQPALSR